MKSKTLRLSLIAAVVACCFVLSGCISHWFEDSTTRLQIENRTGSDIVEIDIVSKDETVIRPWIQDTIRDSSVSRVYEEDWVGDFKGRIVYANSVGASAQKGFFNIELSGGSLYLVFTRNPAGTLHFESR